MALCLSEKEFIEVNKRLKVKVHFDWINRGADATTHLYDRDNGTTCIVCVRITPGISYEQVAAMLVHEAVHIYQEYRDGLGEKNPGKEFEAYVIQGISQELLLAYAKQRR